MSQQGSLISPTKRLLLPTAGKEATITGLVALPKQVAHSSSQVRQQLVAEFAI